MRITEGRELFLVLLLSLLASPIRAQQCDPCINGENPLDDDDCEDLVASSLSLAAGTQECALSQMANFQSDCCREPPQGVCTLCPDGASFNPFKVIPRFDPDDGDITCADLNGDEDFLDFIFDAGKCEDTLLQRSAAWCECPAVERQCSLCPRGARPPNPNLRDKVYYGWNCDVFDFVSSYFSTDECGGLVTDIFEFDAPSFCGCPDNPVPNVCNLCPEGEQIVNPKKSLGSGIFNCRELALSTKYIPSVEPCIRVLTSYREMGFVDSCCGVPSSAVNWKLRFWIVILSATAWGVAFC